MTNRLRLAAGFSCALGACSVPTDATEPRQNEATTASHAADAPAAGVRARDLGIRFDGTPGEHNAITDVAGVLVGHATVIDGEGRHAARTGVTAIRVDTGTRVFAAVHTHNGDGEMTGTHYIREFGRLISPILMTNTISIGDVSSAAIKWSLQRDGVDTINLPVVGETWDGSLNDIYGFHVTAEHVFAALDGAKSGPVAEGNVGGGTGMTCHGFKGGIGTSSRRIRVGAQEHTVGILVQANYGHRDELRLDGVPVGRIITDLQPEYRRPDDGDGSILIVIATDVPMTPTQLERVARRATMGLARVGSYASTYSGDIFLAFSTGHGDEPREGGKIPTRYLHTQFIDAVFLATVRATEEAIVNALVAARTMTGVNGNRVYGLPHERVKTLMRRD